MSNPTFATIDDVRRYVEDYMDGFRAKVEAGVAIRAITRLTFPPPANKITESELLEIIVKSILEEVD